ncbi:TetR/AcrR family transcriptional regulator [Aeromicrobium wangtongii]|uniref:TetR/AcrR family transcriptional regulator n=1 Tax=Aeromicrobium wangtongii TaxID=2969247 RepID=UPI002017CF34|nr:TetR/AcrR family transcriptional regulator [Aeromicrobium wangtongii]MCL3819214.1 TetR/AcrR family transcriptional regulator [Aeromicrobium wangtongii]
MPRSRPPADLRRAPQQERSQAMVERIVTAGQAVLEREGYSRFTTNRVAVEAGISPGSLYQYFADKHAVLAAVVDRHSAQLSTQLTGVLTAHLDRPGPELVRATLDGLMDALEHNVEFLRLIVEQLPRAQYGDRTAALEQRIGDLVSAYLQINRPRSRVHEPATSAWMLVRTVEHLAVQYVLEDPDITRERFVEELAAMVLAYVAPHR